MLSSSLNATRFAQKPLAQPSYSFADVPAAHPDLRHSSLQYVDNREAFHSCMAEMLLLCKEATRRRRRHLGASACAAGEAAAAAAAKPLSLEYLADRIDVDDPIFGFVVRTADNERLASDAATTTAGVQGTETSSQPGASAKGSGGGAKICAESSGDSAKHPVIREADMADEHANRALSEVRAAESQETVAAKNAESSLAGASALPERPTDYWQRGMLQGFITCTTFTNYQRTFEWDSLNPVAFLFDDEHHHHHRPQEPPSLSSSSISEAREGVAVTAAVVTSGAGSGKGTKGVTPEGGDASDAALGGATFYSAQQPPSASPRARDEDGSLAAEMQATVRCGDIWNEGIVWPRIAEISLLGGLKCGRALVNLVIEHLEFMKASGRCNYDYVVLQATDNSISFYESMGFVRVGAVVKEEPNHSRREGGDSSSYSGSIDGGAMAEAVTEDSAEKPNAVAQSLNVVCSPTIPFTVDKAGDTPADIARRTNVDVFDIVFLNIRVYPEICPRSRLLVGTVLQLPAHSNKGAPAKARSGPQWYLAKENETPRTIARLFNVNCLELVEANRHRIDGLLSNSRLKEGTRLQVSDFDLAHEGEYKPYAHWSFPDDQFEEPEPSYMMARRLDRRKGSANKQRAFEASLAVPITQFEPPSLLLPLSPEPASAIAPEPPAALQASARCASSSASARPRHDPNAPIPPKRPATSFLLFGNEMRVVHKAKLDGLAAIDISRYVANLWNKLSATHKVKYEKKAEDCKQAYLREKAAYQEALECYMASSSTTSTAESSETSAPAGAAASADPGCSRRLLTVSTSGATLYNKVVKLKPGAMTEGSEYTYWYVLTFIPDLRWCHLAPMVPVGTFDKANCQGRPKYKLVDENLGKEVDISSSFCIPIKSRAMKRTLDADKEEWDIIDDGTIDDSCDASLKIASRNVTHGPPTSVPQRFTSCDRLPPLTAKWNRREVSVRITYDTEKVTAGKRKRPSMAFSPASFSSSSNHSDSEPPRKKHRQPAKRDHGRQQKHMLKQPPESHASPLASSPSTARSRSQPPASSRTSPGRAAALLSLGHRQLLHSPLVRVRGSRPVVPEVVRFAQFPPAPEAPVARSSRGRSLTPSSRFASTVSFDESALGSKRRPSNQSRSVDVLCTATRPRNASSVYRSPKLDMRWNSYALRLKEYRQEHGNCRVPRSFPEDQSFANWVHNQRYSKTLTKARIDLLNDLSFEWNAGSSNKDHDLNNSNSAGTASPERSDRPDPQPGAVELETAANVSSRGITSEVKDNHLVPPAFQNTSGDANRRRERRKEARGRRSTSEALVASLSMSDEDRQSDPLDIRQREVPTQDPSEVEDVGEVSVGRRTRRLKSLSSQRATLGGSTSLSQPPPPKSFTNVKEDPLGSGSSSDTSRRVSSRVRDNRATSSAPTVVNENKATGGISQTRSTAASSATSQSNPQPNPTTNDAERESDADDSTRSSVSSRRRQCNSPLVHRSIRKRQGRHVNQRNELPAPEPRASRESSFPAARKRLRSSAVEEDRHTPKSPEKSSQSHKGTMARELLSLLPFDQARQRRQVNGAGSRRSILQS